LHPVNREVTGSSGGLYTLHDVWERPPANNLPQTPHSAGAYGTGYLVTFRGAHGSLALSGSRCWAKLWPGNQELRAFDLPNWVHKTVIKIDTHICTCYA